MLLFFIIMIFNQIDSFGQFSSLKDSPMFKNNKHNIFRETLTNTYYEMSEMDSLYKTGKSPFQILSNIKKGDSIVWMIKFINEDDFTIKSQWLNKKFPLKDFVDIHNIQIKTSELTGKFLIIYCWSVSCGPCIKELPYLNALKDSLNKDNYILLGVTFDNSVSIRNFFKSNQLNTYLNDENPSFAFRIIPNQKEFLNNVLGVKSYPTTFIVDKKGFIKQIIEGVNLDEQKKPKIYSEIMETLKRIE
ncbi:antioxidant, AhpC/TSA family [Prevotella sp. DNF00663]|nr:antioxidant, AhpC/TSA family [Prevotella sp. DNF00663]